MKEIIPVPAKLKQKVEDFIVEEIGEKWPTKISEKFIQPKIEIENNEQKDFLWCEMEKKDLDHFTTIKNISELIGKQSNDIGYAGTKDKRAWTSQRISIFKPNIDKIKDFKHPHIILKNFKWNKRKIKIGYLDANHFKITLREVERKDAIKITNHIRSTSWFPNYFGPQRFGINGNNVKIGKLLLKKEFEKAAKEIAGDNPRKKEIIEYYLRKNPKDFLGALKKLERKSMLMYINAVQSKIFNDILEQALEEGLSFTNKGQTSCLLIGYKTRFFNGRLGEIEQQTLKNHNLTLEDFDLKEIPYLRIKGSFRKAVTEIKDLEIEILDDEENPEFKKIILEFTLPSGVYATTFLENFFILN
jgi:tRNA pseudouridine13 synthase